MKEFFKKNEQGYYFTGENEADIIKKLHIENEPKDYQQANIQLYLAYRNSYIKKDKESQDIIQKATTQFNKIAQKYDKEKNIHELKQDIIKSTKDIVITPLIETGINFMLVLKYLPYILIVILVIYFIFKVKK